MTIDNLFIIKDELPYLNKEARNIKPLYDIIVRDAGKVTNVHGEKKRIKSISRKELAFIYYYLNKEMFANYKEEDERNKVILKRLDIDWEIDELVWKAIRELEEDFTTVQKKLTNGIRSNLHNYVSLTKLMNIKNEQLMSELLALDITNLTTEQISHRNDLLRLAQEDVTNTLKMTKDLKEAFKNLNELEIEDKATARRLGKNRLETDKNIYKRKEIDV